ncbi:MAG: hypothetical protein IK027_04275 [Deltaproteobacteria bacterium]|nr:hypothetical protein [Deltaproteobacteria bacterium]
MLAKRWILWGAAFLLLASPALTSADVIRDSRGNSVGRIESNGTVRDGRGNSIGRIESSGTVRDGRGSSIGSAQGVNPHWAAAFFFFDFFR